jgi:hypothetical protein
MSTQTLAGQLTDAATGLVYDVSITQAQHAAPIPPGPVPSPDGAQATTPATVLVTADLCSWRLAGAAGAYTVQYQTAGSTTWPAAGHTAAVTRLMTWGGHIYQTSPNASSYGSPGWWKGTVTATTVTWAEVPGDPSLPPPVTSGRFLVAAGTVTDPSGKAWRANGINCLYRQVWGNGGVDLARFSAAALKRGFPGLNFVRFADLYSYGLNQAAHPATDATVRNWVADLNAAGIVVYAEVHYTGNYATGQALTDGCTWLTEWANFGKGNPMLWLGTQNEPHGDAGGISRMMRIMYNAVRATGNLNPVLFCTGNPGAEIIGMDAAQFADTDNTGFDPHYYGWNPANGVRWQDILNQCAAFHNKQGPMSSLCLETGDATDGNYQDANWEDVLNQSLNNACGSAAWWANWAHGNGGDELLAAPFDFSHLTAYGTFVRDAMHAPF